MFGDNQRLEGLPPNEKRLSCAAVLCCSQEQFYYDGRRQLQPLVRQTRDDTEQGPTEIRQDCGRRYDKESREHPCPDSTGKGAIPPCQTAYDRSNHNSEPPDEKRKGYKLKTRKNSDEDGGGNHCKQHRR